MKNLAAVALGAAVLALILSCVGLVVALHAGAAGDDGQAGEISALRRDVKSLDAEVARLSSATRALAARDQVRPPAAAKAGPADPDRLARLVDERVREALVLSGGKAGLRPDALPPAVRDAVAGILGNAEITSAEQRGRDGRSYFRLRARLDGQQYDLRIWSDGEVVEAEMPPDRAPDVVKDAVARTVEGIRLTRVRRQIDNDLPVFDIEGRLGGEKYDMKIAPDGRVIEAEMPPDRAPEAVRDAVARTVEGIRLTRVRQQIDNDRPIFDVEGRLGGEKYDMKIAPDGRVVDADLWPGGVTAAVRDAAVRAVAGIELTDAKIDTENGRQIYELKGKAAGDDYRIKLTLDGRPIEIRGPDGRREFDVGVDKAPAPAAPAAETQDGVVF